MPTYGRGFILDSSAKTGFYAPAKQPIPAGPYTRVAGFLGYNEVRSYIVHFKLLNVYNLLLDLCKVLC